MFHLKCPIYICFICKFMDTLYEDCIYCIFTHIDPIDIFECSIVNKLFNKISKLENLWKYYIAISYKDYPKKDTYFETFVLNYKLNKSRKDFHLEKHNSLTDIFEAKNISMKSRNRTFWGYILDKTIPSYVNCFINAEKFRVPPNRIEKIPVELCELVNLTELSLRENEIESIPKEIGNLINLKCLDLYHNNIKEIPIEIGNLINLIVLDFAYNKIKLICVEIFQLSKLIMLNFIGNSIEEIPDNISALVSVKEFSLDFNPIKDKSKKRDPRISINFS